MRRNEFTPDELRFGRLLRTLDSGQIAPDAELMRRLREASTKAFLEAHRERIANESSPIHAVAAAIKRPSRLPYLRSLMFAAVAVILTFGMLPQSWFPSRGVELRVAFDNLARVNTAQIKFRNNGNLNLFTVKSDGIGERWRIDFASGNSEIVNDGIGVFYNKRNSTIHHQQLDRDVDGPTVAVSDQVLKNLSFDRFESQEKLLQQRPKARIEENGYPVLVYRGVVPQDGESIQFEAKVNALTNTLVEATSQRIDSNGVLVADCKADVVMVNSAISDQRFLLEDDQELLASDQVAMVDDVQGRVYMNDPVTSGTSMPMSGMSAPGALASVVNTLAVPESSSQQQLLSDLPQDYSPAMTSGSARNASAGPMKKGLAGISLNDQTNSAAKAGKELELTRTSDPHLSRNFVQSSGKDRNHSESVPGKPFLHQKGVPIGPGEAAPPAPATNSPRLLTQMDVHKDSISNSTMELGIDRGGKGAVASELARAAVPPPTARITADSNSGSDTKQRNFEKSNEKGLKQAPSQVASVAIPERELRRSIQNRIRVDSSSSEKLESSVKDEMAGLGTQKTSSLAPAAMSDKFQLESKSNRMQSQVALGKSTAQPSDPQRVDSVVPKGDEPIGETRPSLPINVRAKAAGDFPSGQSKNKGDVPDLARKSPIPTASEVNSATGTDHLYSPIQSIPGNSPSRNSQYSLPAPALAPRPLFNDVSGDQDLGVADLPPGLGNSGRQMWGDNQFVGEPKLDNTENSLRRQVSRLSRQSFERQVVDPQTVPAPPIASEDYVNRIPNSFDSENGRRDQFIPPFPNDRGLGARQVRSEVEILPGMSLSTAEGVESVVRARLANDGYLVVGPSSAVVLIKPTEIRLEAGEIEISVPPGDVVELAGPETQPNPYRARFMEGRGYQGRIGTPRLQVIDRKVYRLEKNGIQRLYRDPAWLTNYYSNLSKREMNQERSTNAEALPIQPSTTNLQLGKDTPGRVVPTPPKAGGSEKTSPPANEPSPRPLMKARSN